MNRTAQQRGLIFLVFTLATALVSFFIFKFPTLDFDEALYRSVADSMKRAHNPWLLNWDGRELYHKPPIFYWLVCLFSFVIDGKDAAVSLIACRMPSFLATLGILASLYHAGKRFLADDQEIGKNAALAFLCALFPMLTATSVIFDPLQTFLLMPAIIVPALLFFDEKKIRPTDWAWWSLSLFAASATKGLNGIIVPTFAFGMHALACIRMRGFDEMLDLAVKFTVRVFLPAVALTALFFVGLSQTIGPAFTHEFIWIQHFERGTSPMEQHSGSFFYQFFVVFFGGGLLMPLLFSRLGNIRKIFNRFGFPLTYALSVLVVFGFSATKLPHYSWPAWPALCLFIGLIPASPASSKRELEFQFVALAPVALLGVFSLSLALAPKTLLGLFAKTPSFLGVIKYFNGFSRPEAFAFLVAALLSFAFIAKRKTVLARLERSAAISLAIALCLSFGFEGTVKSLMVTPFYQIADTLRKDGAMATDCIRYSGALSPTFSLALAPDLLHNRCEPEAMRYLIAPEWKAKECEERNFKIIDHKSYLVLCKRGS